MPSIFPWNWLKIVNTKRKHNNNPESEKVINSDIFINQEILHQKICNDEEKSNLITTENKSVAENEADSCMIYFENGNDEEIGYVTSNEVVGDIDDSHDGNHMSI